MDNHKIAAVFEEMGNILDIQGATFFRVNAYRKAALTIENLAHDLRSIYENEPENLDNIPGIGKGLKDKIVELLQTGKCQEHEDLKKDFPSGLLEILNIRGVGPKKVKMFYTKLNITSIAELKAAAQNHELSTLEGMGEKSETEILNSINEFEQFDQQRTSVDKALNEALRLVDYLKKCAEIDHVTYAGSLRRCQETVGDLDILTTVKNAEKSHNTVMDFFIDYPEKLKLIARGDTKSSLILNSGLQVDLRVVDNDSFGAALHYFTGSKEHNILVRDLAKKKNMKVNEYGVFRGEEKVAGKTEKDLFEILGLPYLIPEIRQGNIEISYGLENKIMPTFIEEKDIRGDLHSHSNYSDGKNTIGEMAAAFAARGYSYFAVTDHSGAVGITHGLNKEKITKQWEEIDQLNKENTQNFRILKGIEVDILKDGSLDFDEQYLKKLDIVVASAHLHTKLSHDEQTKRLLQAIANPNVKILGHPTGRLVNKRPEMEFDMEKILKACAIHNVAIEINSNPQRLDLVDKYVRMAKDLGIKFVINTDSHATDHPDFIKFGIGVARRGWLTPQDVLNTLPATELLNALRKK